MYEINQWLWQFGRGKRCLGGLSVAETDERRISVAKEGAKRAVATRTRRHRKALKAAGAPGGLEIVWYRISIEYPGYNYL